MPHRLLLVSEFLGRDSSCLWICIERDSEVACRFREKDAMMDGLAIPALVIVAVHISYTGNLWVFLVKLCWWSSVGWRMRDLGIEWGKNKKGGLGSSPLGDAVSQTILTVSPQDGSPGLPSSFTVETGSHPICVFNGPPLLPCVCLYCGLWICLLRVSRLIKQAKLGFP